MPDNLGDPALFVWIMSWVSHSLTTQPENLFDGPMFWPAESTLAYSDVLITPAVPFAVIHEVTGSWTASLIGVSLLLVVLAEVGAYAAALRITGRRDAAVIAAIAFAFGGYTLGRWASVQLISVGILALCLVAFLHLLAKPSIPRGFFLGGAALATFYASAYYGALALLLLALLAPSVLLWQIFRRHPSAARLLVGLTVAGAVTGAGILPTAMVGLRLQRDLDQTRPLSPQFDLVARDVLRPTKGSYVWKSLDVPAPEAPYEHQFFPGAIAILLGGIGAVVVTVRFARRQPVGPPDRPRAGAELALLSVAGVFSLALATGSAGVGPFAPWKLVHAYVPGFAGIRVASRLAVPTLLVGAVFAAVGYAALTTRLRSRPPLQAAAAILCTTLMLIELSAPHQWARIDTSEAQMAVYRALDRRPAGPVLELPMPDPRTEALVYTYLEAPRLVYGTIDWHPRVNGYAGYLPPGYELDLAIYPRFPEPSAIDRLSFRGVRYVILHIGQENGIPALTEADAAERLLRLPAGATSTREGSAYLIDLRASPA